MALQNQQRIKQIRLHLFRILVFVSILILIRSTHYQFSKALKSKSPTINLDLATKYFPQSVKLAPSEHIPESWAVVDPSESVVGYFLETSPMTDNIVGFSGPTNCLIVLTDDLKIRDVRVISSGDTKEHLEEVQKNKKFWQSFINVKTSQLNELQIDAVSGATLTSLAVAQSIQTRLGSNSQSSLKFPEELNLEDVKQLFPNVSRIVSIGDFHAWHVENVNGNKIGLVLRSSPIADNIVGYQGPTDFLIGLDDQDLFTNLIILDSYDNQPYVRYVADDIAFLQLHAGKTFDQLSAIKSDSLDFEGVSGATMTSQAIVSATQLMAVEFLKNRNMKSSTWLSRIQVRDFGTIFIILMGIVLAFTKLRGSKKLKLVFQFLLIGYLGLVNGDLLSQALIAGWAQTQIPWSTATGLVFLSGAAIILPVCSRRNVYCSHVCPHGALQQLVKGKMPYQIKLPATFRKALKLLPGTLVIWCLLVTILHLPFSLVDIEPFNAWVFKIAGWATLTVAIIGMIAALFVPMAYCKFGCPTGAILNFLRFNSRSDRWNRADSLACSMLLLAIGVRVFG